MNNKTFQLFVYGSLRSGFQHAAYQYLSKYFHLLGNATVKGKLYDMGEYPVAVPTDEERFIVGELYEINNTDEFSYAIGQLDDYEGLYAEEGQTAFYKREAVTVYCNGSQSTAWVYCFTGCITGLAEMTTGDIFEYLQQKNKW